MTWIKSGVLANERWVNTTALPKCRSLKTIFMDRKANGYMTLITGGIGQDFDPHQNLHLMRGIEPRECPSSVIVAGLPHPSPSEERRQYDDCSTLPLGDLRVSVVNPFLGRSRGDFSIRSVLHGISPILDRLTSAAR